MLLRGHALPRSAVSSICQMRYDNFAQLGVHKSLLFEAVCAALSLGNIIQPGSEVAFPSLPFDGDEWDDFVAFISQNIACCDVGMDLVTNCDHIPGSCQRY